MVKTAGNSFLSMAKARKTTYEFTEKKVKDADLRKILEAARWAPSCSNEQPWHFIVVRNKNRIFELMRIANHGAFHTDPSLMIAIVLNLECWTNGKHICVKNDKTGIPEAYLCIAMPALNICYEALDLGISSCLITPTQWEAHKILKTRLEDAVPLIVGLGYEKKGVFQKKREREPLKELVSYESFKRSRE